MWRRDSPKPPKGKSKGKGKGDDRTCYNCGKSGDISRNCPNAVKGKGKGKSSKGSYYGGKASWSQPSNGIKSLCSVVAKPRVQGDLEGFAKATKTVKPVISQPILSLSSSAKFFPPKVENNQNQVLKETKGLKVSKKTKTKQSQ